MKYSILVALLLSGCSLSMAEDITSETKVIESMSSIKTPCEVPAKVAYSEPVLTEKVDMHITVLGQGVAPMNSSSPAQAYAMAKRAAIADAYRLIAEKVKGVRVDGQDTIRNMMVKRSTVKTSVNAMVQNAKIVETNFKDGLCEVEMEITLSHSLFAH